MSFATNLQTAFTRVATEFNTLRSEVQGALLQQIGALGNLTTTDKSNVVAAINEVASSVGSAAGIDDNTVSTTSTWSSQKTSDEIDAAAGAQTLDGLTDVTITTPANNDIVRWNAATSQFVNAAGTDVFQPLDTDLTAIAALATTAYGRALLTLADQAALLTTIGTANTNGVGVVELATTAETTTGTDTARAVTPAGVAAAIAGKANTSSLAAVATSGNAADLTGTLPTSVLPPLAVNDVSVVNSQAAMLALTAQRGDVAVRTDVGKTYILSADDATTLGNWVEITAAGAVISVAGKTGAVTLNKSDVGLSNVDNTSDLNKPISTATQTALDGKQPLDADLTAIAALVSAANQLPYATGSGTWALTTLSAFGRSLIDDADAATARGTLGVYSTTEIGDVNTDFAATFVAGLA